MASIKIELLQKQIKEIVGMDWLLSEKSSLPMPDEEGVIHCHLFIQHKKDPDIEHSSIFTINSRPVTSITSQLYDKLLQIKRRYKLGNNYKKQNLVK